MIQAKCIQKFRDKNNNIIGYRLQDLNGQTQDVTPSNLKMAIKNKQIHVINLTLSSDNRLMDTNEKQLKSKSLGREPKFNNTNDTIANVAKALTYIDYSILDMGDSYKDIVQNIVYASGENISITTDDTNRLKRISVEAYISMLNNKTNKVMDILGYRTKYADDIINSASYENATSKSKSKMYKALKCVLAWLSVNGNTDLVNSYSNIMKELENMLNEPAQFGYNIGHEYFRYLDEKIFGTITNDFFTVGHKVTSSDEKRYQPYNYILHTSISKLNHPELVVCIGIRNDKGYLAADLSLEWEGYVGTSSVSVVEKVVDVATIRFRNKSDIEHASKQLAEAVNTAGAYAYEYAKKNPKYMHLRPLQ